MGHRGKQRFVDKKKERELMTQATLAFFSAGPKNEPPKTELTPEVRAKLQERWQGLADSGKQVDQNILNWLAGLGIRIDVKERAEGTEGGELEKKEKV